MSRLTLFSASIACLLASTTLANAAATVTLSPGSGSPTAALTVTVKGFTAGRLVDVFFDTEAKCVIVAAGATGTGRCVFAVPKDAQPTSHWVTAADRATHGGVQKTFLVRSNWPEARGLGVGHDGFNRYENTISPQNAHLLSGVWTVLGTVPVYNSPIVYRGRLYVGAGNGKLYAFDASTGAAIAGFVKTLGTSITYSSPVAVDGIVYQAAIDTPSTSKIHAFDASTGKAVFAAKAIGGQVRGSPIVVAGRLHVGAADGKIYGFDAKTGATLAPFPITVPAAPVISTTPTSAGGRIMFGANDGEFYTYDLITGAQVRSLNGTGLYDLSSPATVNGAVYVVNPIDLKLHALDLSDGSSLWASSFTMPGLSDGTPAIAGGRVFVTDGTPALRAIDRASGDERWATSLGTGIGYAAPTVANGVVIAGTTKGIHAVEAATGRLLWSSARRVSSNQSVPIVNGMIYVPSPSGGVTAHAIRGASGASAPSVARPAMSELKPDLSLKP